MSGRVNPITYLARRLSKTLSKGGNSDAANTSTVAPGDEDLDSTSYRPPRRLPSAHVSRSAERSRLVKRRWSKGSGGQAPREKTPSVFQARSASACPAPLAQSDCFDLTDVSDFEPEVKRTDSIGQEDHTSADKGQIESAREIDGQSFVDSESYKMSTSSSREDLSDEESMISIKENVDPDLHQTEDSVIDAGYDFDYPTVKRSESDEALDLEVERTLPPADDSSSEESTRREREVDDQASTDADEISLSKESDVKRTATDPADAQTEVCEYDATAVYGKDEAQLPVGNREPAFEDASVSAEAKVPMINVQTEDGTHSDWEEPANYDQQVEWAQNNHNDLGQGGMEYDIPEEEEEVTFEVEHDAAQDPFHEAVLSASRAKYLRDPPAIMVTSPSNHDLTPHSPKRPPPPIVPPPSPSEAIKTATPPPRPPAPPPVSATKSSPNCTEDPASVETKPLHSPKKKHKIFGVSVGPLPSDPDPNFPFKSHFEKKHIVPNPKKALQHIVSGEKRKDRLHRKAEAELERILKGGGDSTADQKKHPGVVAKETTKTEKQPSYISDWEEFQARVEATVQDSTSKLQTLKLEELQQDSSVDDNWASFKADFDTEAQTKEEGTHEEPLVSISSPNQAEKEPQIEEEKFPGNLTKFEDTHSSATSAKLPPIPTTPSIAQAKSPAFGQQSEQVSENWANFDNYFSEKDGTPQALVEELNKSNFWDESKTTELTENWAHFEEGSHQFVAVNEINDTPLEVVSDSRTEFDTNITFEKLNFDLVGPQARNQEAPTKVGSEEPLDLFSDSEATVHSAGKSDSLSATIENPLNVNSDLPEGGESTFTSGYSTRQTEIDHLICSQDAAIEGGTFQVSSKMESSSPEGLLLSSSTHLADGVEYEESSQVRMNSSEESISPTHSVQDFVDEVLQEAKDCKDDSIAFKPVSNLGAVALEAGLDNVLVNGNNEKMTSTTKDRDHVELQEPIDKISNYSLLGTFKDSSSQDMVRTRAMPKRQGTLTENNPFRCTARSDKSETPEQLPINEEELAIEDEKTTLATVALFSRSVTDEDEEVVIGEELVQEDGEEQNGAFNPFQTIYPASEKESSEEDGAEDEEPIKTGFPQVEIKPENAVESGTEKATCIVPLLPAPPRPATPAFQQEEKSGLDDFSLSPSSEKAAKGFALKDETPSGWETFSETTTVPRNQATVDISESELVKAFEVDWSEPPPAEPKATPVPLVPEPPRPETPDPALEEPFTPAFPMNQVWRLWLRFPEKKKKVKQLSKYTSDRTWKEVAVTLTEDRGRCEINLHDIDSETGTHSPQPFRTLRTEPYMQLSRCKLQQYDKYGKLNIFKVNHVTYRELPGMRPEKFSLKTLQQLVSHKPKQNVALDHIPIYSEILKFGSLDQTLMRGLMSTLEDALMRIPSHKDEGLSYSHEEICCYVIDEYIGEVSENGIIRDQRARTRIFCSAFVNKGPHIVLGINDKWRFGREIVRRSDILPVMHDEWITVWKPEFHSCLEMEDYEKDHMLKFYPLDGCKFELMRFRVSLRNNRELPLQVYCTYSIDDRRVSMRCELLVPGYFTASQRSGAVPCEDVEIRIPVPEEWIYHFRVEKHNRYGSVHSTLRKPGKIKGLERITQMAQSLLPPSLLEASIGLAKYEHIYKAVVWRIPRVPEKNEASYRPHLLTCNLLLASHDVVPEWDTLVKTVHIEYSMPSSTVSGTTVRSISVETTGNAEKFVKYTAKYRYTVDINYQLGQRKEKPLKGLFDEPAQDEKASSSSDSEPEVDEETESCHEAANGETNPETSETAEGDLLGLGISSISPAGALEDGRQEIQPSSASNANDLADIFG
ncbi:hypothetical protein AAHC03_09893 [Spirometra sp. Aus1]